MNAGRGKGSRELKPIEKEFCTSLIFRPRRSAGREGAETRGTSFVFPTLRDCGACCLESCILFLERGMVCLFVCCLQIPRAFGNGGVLFWLGTEFCVLF